MPDTAIEAGGVVLDTGLLFGPDWESWEMTALYQLEHGEIKAVPWALESWWLSALASRPDLRRCWVHLAVEHVGQVAYYKSVEHAEAGRLTTCRPGKFLKRWFPDMPQAELSRWAAQAAAISRATVDTPAESEEWIKFADTRESIRWVYEHGPASCMSKDADFYESRPDHPTEVYAAGDLAVAYMVYPNRPEYVLARVVCWPERKKCGRYYYRQNEELHNDGLIHFAYIPDRGCDDYTGFILREHIIRPFIDGLARLGFDVTEQSLAGAKLLRIEKHNGLVAPYTDYPHNVEDDGNFLILTDRSGYCTDQSGLVQYEPPQRCVRCGAEYDNEEEELCEDCRDSNRCCDRCGSEFDCRNEGTYIDRNNTWICDYCLLRYYAECCSCNEQYHVDDMERNSSGDRYCESCWEDGQNECPKCGDVQHYSEMTEFSRTAFCAECHAVVTFEHEAVPEGWVRVGTQDRQMTLDRAFNTDQIVYGAIQTSQTA